MTPRSALLLIPQSPLDSTSGAAVSEKTTCEMLVRAGWQVSAVATVASESFTSQGSRRLEDLGIEAERHTLPSGVNWLRFLLRGVDYRLLDSGGLDVNSTRARFAADLDRLVEDRLSEGVPHVVVTYGSSEAEVRRRGRLRAAGARVVFSLHNLEYRSGHAFAEVDRILTPSRHCTDHYRREMGVDSTPLPVPVTLEDVVPPAREPSFFTLINPTEAKGARLFIRLARECAERWPEIAFLAVEARGSGNRLARMIEAAGVARERLPNLFVAGNTPNAASLYAVTRVLLMPSLMEASGRSAVEAQLNGIPVVSSDRGGLPETVGAGGLTLPAVPDPEAVEAQPAVERWLDAIKRLHTDAAFYDATSRAAAENVAAHRNGLVERERVAFFEGVASQPVRGVGPGDS
jgi:glycosyltransferase involved in cell wall biosynthesis